jgi:hypothetical protein
MFKKELADVLKQTVLFLAFLFALPALMVVLNNGPKWPYSVLVVPVVQAGLLFWSFFLGASLFGRERGQHSLEYALALPYSRWSLLLRLAGPRAIVLFALWTLTLLPPRLWVENHAFLSPGAFFLFSVVIFAVALSLAPLIDNFLVLAFGTLMALVLWILVLLGAGVAAAAARGFSSEYFVFPLGRYAEGLPAGNFPVNAYFMAFLMALPFVAALIVSFPAFDTRTSRRFRGRFATVLLPCFLLVGLFFFGASDRMLSANSYQSFYLTKDLHLVEIEFLSNRPKIHSATEVRRIRLGSSGFWRAFEDGGFLYIDDFSGNLKRISLSSGAVETIYSSPGGQIYNHEWIDGSDLVFFEKGPHPREMQLVRLDTASKKIRRVTFTQASPAKGVKYILAAGTRGGKRFWIFSFWDVSRDVLFRLWDDGRIEDILEGKNLKGRWFCYDGLLLCSGKDSLVALKDDGTSFKIVKEFPAGESFRPPTNPFFEARLDRPGTGFIYGKRNKVLARMNLETLEIEDVGAWAEGQEGSWGYVVNPAPGKFYFEGGNRNRSLLEIYDLSDGQMKLIWTAPEDISQGSLNQVNIFESGIVARIGKTVRAYAFPDMREIKFK